MNTPLHVACTGVAATWCPIHDDCTCRQRLKATGVDGRAWQRDTCPLHGAASTHPNAEWTADPLDVLRAAHVAP